MNPWTNDDRSNKGLDSPTDCAKLESTATNDQDMAGMDCSLTDTTLPGLIPLTEASPDSDSVSAEFSSSPAHNVKVFGEGPCKETHELNSHSKDPTSCSQNSDNCSGSSPAFSKSSTSSSYADSLQTRSCPAEKVSEVDIPFSTASAASVSMLIRGISQRFTKGSGVKWRRRQRSALLMQELQVLDPELLRAAPMRLLLRGLGSIFRTSKGDASTFDMSEPVAKIETFISHSWLTAGWLKTLALMYRANQTRAAVASFVTTIVQVAAQWYFDFRLPETGDTFYPDCSADGCLFRTVRLDLSFTLPCLVFLVFIVFGQELPGLSTGSCFLDKCCIHQVDEEKKLRGIQQLGGFLRSSQRMVILWQPEYLSRMWCAYEIAAFHYINIEIDDVIELVPLKLPLLSMSLFGFHFLSTVLLHLAAPLTGYSELHVSWMVENLPPPAHFPYMFGSMSAFFLGGVYLLPGMFFWYFCKWHMQDRKMLLKQLREFSLDSTQCYSETDREFIMGKIKKWFGSVGEFELVVQTEIARLVSRQFEDRGPVPWSVLFTGAFSHLFAVAFIASDFLHNGQYERALQAISVGLVMACCTDAIAVSIGLRLADGPIGERGGLWKLVGPLLVAVMFAIPVALMTAMIILPLSATVLIPILGSQVIMTWFFFGGLEQLRAIRRQGLLTCLKSLWRSRGDCEARRGSGDCQDDGCSSCPSARSRTSDRPIFNNDIVKGKCSRVVDASSVDDDHQNKGCLSSSGLDTRIEASAAAGAGWPCPEKEIDIV
mmetsp:Transcript_3372/g.7511  ORF Transcript_3372/g.7511 Transcript_3372/m.7511 type:complete len:770 (+) Transcript_3372:174-2483(+)